VQSSVDQKEEKKEENLDNRNKEIRGKREFLPETRFGFCCRRESF